MPYHLGDTICAIATPSGGAARGMVRISGPAAVTIADRLFQPRDATSIDALSQATAITGEATILLGKAATVPCDLYLWPTSRSYTREPVAELHTLGSPPILESLVAEVCQAGARLAEPGEFTLRAFLAGRIDLTQAEAVLGVIDARGQDELSGALAQLAGGIASPLHDVRKDLLQLLAELEAGLDFVEEDIEFVSAHEVAARLTSAVMLLDEVRQQIESRYATDSALQVVLTGAPNVGKSSLFNAMVKRFGIESERRPAAPALVSPQSGTTRDYLTATIDLEGVRCELVDTAGIEAVQPIQEIERQAQRLAGERGARASLRLLCLESANAADIGYDAGDFDLVVFTKSDATLQDNAELRVRETHTPCVATSSVTGEGLEKLNVALHQLLTHDSCAHPAQIVPATADRCRESIRQADAALRRAIGVIDADGGDELVSAEIRNALAELGQVVGAIYTEDLLDRIFSTFCIGK